VDGDFAKLRIGICVRAGPNMTDLGRKVWIKRFRRISPAHALIAGDSTEVRLLFALLATLGHVDNRGRRRHIVRP